MHAHKTVHIEMVMKSGNIPNNGNVLNIVRLFTIVCKQETNVFECICMCVHHIGEQS